MLKNGKFLDRFVCFCFGGGSSSPPPPTPTPPPPSKMDEGAAGREANLRLIRQSQASGFNSTVGTSPMGDQSATPSEKRTLLGG